MPHYVSEMKSQNKADIIVCWIHFSGVISIFWTFFHRNREMIKIWQAGRLCIDKIRIWNIKIITFFATFQRRKNLFTLRVLSKDHFKITKRFHIDFEILIDNFARHLLLALNSFFLYRGVCYLSNLLIQWNSTK